MVNQLLTLPNSISCMEADMAEKAAKNKILSKDAKRLSEKFLSYTSSKKLPLRTLSELVSLPKSTLHDFKMKKNRQITKKTASLIEDYLNSKVGKF